MEKMMKVARMHEVGGEMKIEHIPVPAPGPNDVLVRVRSCGIVPNLANILANWTTWFPELPLPPLPAIFGLDPAGEIAAVWTQVHDWKVGERVYVNPGRYCGGCRACRSGNLINCTYYTFNGAVGALGQEHKLEAKVGETVRIYFGVGGPNKVSSFHVIGEIFDRVYSEGATNTVKENVQTTLVPAGGATIVEFKVQHPGKYILVDHALSRAGKGLSAALEVTGKADTGVYQASDPGHGEMAH